MRISKAQDSRGFSRGSEKFPCYFPCFLFFSLINMRRAPDSMWSAFRVKHHIPASAFHDAWHKDASSLISDDYGQVSCLRPDPEYRHYDSARVIRKNGFSPVRA